MAASQRRSSYVGLFLLAIVVMAAMAEANCTVKNNSGTAIELLPSLGTPIVVKPGATVSVPVSALNSKFKNLSTGHILGPLGLVDGTILVIVDGIVKATVDIYVATSILGTIQLKLGALICISL